VPTPGEPAPRRPRATADVRRRARNALAIAAALYVGYGALRVVLPGAISEYLGLVLIACFYFVPAFALRREPELAERWEVGPETPVPRWRWTGAKVALVACLFVFPPFVVGFFWFYAQVCDGDLTLLQPAIWLEGFTPWEGRLEGFMNRLCARHGGELWPQALRIPSKWLQWGGLGLPYEVAIGIFAIALPEEVFHRGYLMSALEELWPPRHRVLGVRFGVAALLSSAVFALGHLVGMAETARLGTFFPALVFAWLWRRSGSLWAPALFHTASNLLMDVLLASTFPGR
jgi:membrane protease YdiL (CAAX protease family)